MRFEVERTRRLLHTGAPLALALPGRIGFELRLVFMAGCASWSGSMAARETFSGGVRYSRRATGC